MNHQFNQSEEPSTSPSKLTKKMLLFQSIVVVAIMAVAVNAFTPCVKTQHKFANKVTTPRMFSSMDQLSFFTAELFSGPAAKYNGELIDKSLKLVDSVPKPAGYVYGEVAPGAEIFLAFGALAIVGAGALIPFILSIGESAQTQQREREATDKIGAYSFSQNKKKTIIAAPAVKAKTAAPVVKAKTAAPVVKAVPKKK
jgi:flagellar basal body-associated protein FliL